MKILALTAAAIVCFASHAEARNRATLSSISVEPTPQMHALELEADTIWHAMFTQTSLVYSYRIGAPLAPAWPQMDRSVTLYGSTKVRVQKERCGIWPGDPTCVFLYGSFYTAKPASVNKAAR